MTNTRRSVIDFIKCSKKTLLLIMIVAILSISTTTLISVMLSNYHNFSFPSLGNIKTIGVESYWDPNSENKTETVEWGTLSIDSSSNVTFFIKSVSNYDTTLNINVTDWDPADISDYMNLSWDYNGTVLKPGESIKVTLTLSTSSSSASFVPYLIIHNIKNFAFDIHIIASEK